MPEAPSLCLSKEWGSLTGLVLIAWEGSNTFPRDLSLWRKQEGEKRVYGLQSSLAKGQTVDEYNSSRRKDKKTLKMLLYKAKEKANSQTDERAEIKGNLWHKN